MNNELLEGLSFHLFPATTVPDRMGALHDQVYALWRSVWNEVFRGLQLSEAVLADEFGRQHLIGCIANFDVPVAIHLYSFYSLARGAAREQTYLRQYPDTFFAKLRRLGVEEVMSMEYMTVSPDWRKSKQSLHVGAVLGALAPEVARQFGRDAAIAPARRDHKVHELAHSLGGESIIENVLNHNVACDFVAIRTSNMRPHPDPIVAAAVDQLWRVRSQVLPLNDAGKVLPFVAKVSKVA